MPRSSVSFEQIDVMVKDAALSPDSQVKEKSQRTLIELAASRNIHPASIQGLYESAGRGVYRRKTVPAINIRGITYDVARAVFRAAIKNKVGAFIFEIARSEINYTDQRPGEYAACICAAGMREGFEGPIFLQGDHYQVSQTKYGSQPDKELNAIKELIRESVNAGFLNIDIDASTIVDLSKRTLEEQQEKNCLVTAEMTKFIRSIEPKGVTISVGGEIGEVGKRNSTVEDLRAFMSGYLKMLGTSYKGISKISVQTGTTHGGVVLPDGSIARVEIDFQTLKELSALAREEYGMSGAVQHGASTLPDEAFHHFPEVGTAEVHLATGFQNIIYESKYFPRELLDRVNKGIFEKYSDEKKQGETDDQFLYKTRKKAFGDFKKDMWSIPAGALEGMREELESRFSLLFNKLNVKGTRDLVTKYVST